MRLWFPDIRSWDHPRARGEQALPLRAGPSVAGSSPRARGADRGPPSPCTPSRIIPARAGSRHHPKWGLTSGEDHPRARGEQNSDAAIGYALWGSSPRARGADDVFTRAQVKYGIIPARAGSRPAEMIFRKLVRDHPRARGEQVIVRVCPQLLHGSSPRARGAGGYIFRSIGDIGIIPARAGSSKTNPES